MRVRVHKYKTLISLKSKNSTLKKHIYKVKQITRKIWLLFFIVIKIKEKKVSVQEQCLLLLRILPKFWSRFQIIL